MADANTNPTVEAVDITEEVVDTNPVEDSNEGNVSLLMDEKSLVEMTTCPTVTITPSENYKNHPCYTILNSGRRKELRNMEFRISLIGGILLLNPSTYLPSMYKDDIAVKTWYRKYSAYLKHASKWNRVIMAQCICELDIILEYASGLVAISELASNAQPQSIQEFYSYMNDVRTIVTIVENEPTSTKQRIGKQSGGKRVQDCLNMHEITRDQLDLSNCANCKHNFVFPIGISQIEINLHNDKIKKEYRTKMYEYKNRTKSRRGSSKPKMGRTMSRRLACLCTRMNCLNRSDGVGCLKCEWACLEFKKANKTSRPYFDDNGDCTCPICACSYSVAYFCIEEKKLAEQARMDCLEELDTKKQSKVDSFFSISKTIE